MVIIISSFFFCKNVLLVKHVNRLDRKKVAYLLVVLDFVPRLNNTYSN